MDTEGKVWKFTGWDTETYTNNIQLTYIGDGLSASGGNDAQVAWNGNDNIVHCNDDGANPATTATATTEAGFNSFNFLVLRNIETVILSDLILSNSKR